VLVDLPIKYKWCKVGYMKVVQREAGAMDVTLEIWESTAARASEGGVRALLYQLKISRDIELDLGEGGQYGETLMGGLIPYKDRDTVVSDDKVYNLHCRLINNEGGVASDFDLSFNVADTSEVL